MILHWPQGTPALRHGAAFLGLSVLFNILFNSHYLGLWAEGKPGVFVAYMAITTVMVFGLLLTLSLHRVLFCALVPFLFLVSAVADYFIANFRIRLFGLNTVAFAFESSVEEAAGFIGKELIGWAFLGLAVAGAAIWLRRRGAPRFSVGARLRLILASFLISLGCHLSWEIPVALPFTALSHTVSYLAERYRFQRLAETRVDISGAHPFEGVLEKVTVVLVIGESARSDHFHINGYPRQTTPRAEARGFLSFPDVTACGVSTRIAVPCILTRATPEEPKISEKETSFISVFRRLGFRTAWISNQKFLGRANTTVSAIAREAEWVHYNNRDADNVHMRLLDEDLLPPLERVLRGSDPRQFIVLHSVGSHWLYDNHYPESFRVFQPVCREKSQKYCSPEEIINAYDNSILYTDHFLERVIDAVRDRPSLVFYVSDHGESLGEEGRYGHGHDEAPPEQKKIPMLVWASEQFLGQAHEKMARLRNNLERKWSQADLFHSILDCTGIRSPAIDQKRSICGRTD
jgi:glucan phosphoethanolaminetransferase (alkaline phosphatase superfamily)